MSQKVKPVPDSYHTAAPYLTVKGAAKAIDFYKNAFGAQEAYRIGLPDGSIAHADIVIGNSHVMLADARPDAGVQGASSSTFLYVDDVDATYQQAVRAGAKATQPVQDMFWGDRYGRLVDPFGQEWQIASHKEDVSEDEMKRRMAAMGR